jgi:ATP phosphoribosyltransferase
MSGLSLGIPSKGRLEEQTREAFARSGMPIERPNGARSYQGSSPRAPDLTIRFMPASEIARELIRGTLDLGVTGADLIEDGTEASE